MAAKRNIIHLWLRRCFLTFCLILCLCLIKMLFLGIYDTKLIGLSASTAQLQPVDTDMVPYEPTESPLQSAPVKQEQINKSTSSVNAVTHEAVKLGVLSCVGRINQVASFLTANNKTGVFIFKPQSQPDQHVFSTSFELVRNDNSTIYATTSFFPNQDAVYDTVEYVEVAHEELEKTVFNNLRRIGVIKKNIIVLDGGTVKVFLMPAGSGTVVIKKEIIQ